MKNLKEWAGAALPSDLLIMAPHPDDDVLGCSGLMRRVADKGGRVTVAWLTDGGSSHGDLGPAQRRTLTERRRAEALAGVSALNIVPEAAHFLDYPDGNLRDHSAAAARRLQAIVTEGGIDTVVVTDGADGHPDHRAAFAIAKSLVVRRIYSYPISSRYDGEPFSVPDDAVYIPPEETHFKREAISRHRSQTEKEGAVYPLSSATLTRFLRDPEIFIPARGPGR